MSDFSDDDFSDGGDYRRSRSPSPRGRRSRSNSYSSRSRSRSYSYRSRSRSWSRSGSERSGRSRSRQGGRASSDGSEVYEAAADPDEDDAARNVLFGDQEWQQEQKEKADAFFDDNNRTDAPAADLLRKSADFLTEYSRRLGEMQETLSDTLSEAWASENELINLDLEPVSQLQVMQMVNTDNIQFNKVVLALSVLAAEMKELSATCRTKFFTPLTMFGHEVPEAVYQELHPNQTQPGLEHQMALFLPLLQDLSNLVSRAFTLAKNTVNQLTCLYHTRQRLYITTYKNVVLTPVFDALGELGRSLLTLDFIIADNQAIEEAWSAYKRMIKYVRGDPQRYGVKDTELRRFESLLLQMDRFIFTANIFEGFLSQDFSLPGPDGNPTPGGAALVSNNPALQQQFQSSVQAGIEKLVAGVGQGAETHPREHIVDLFAVYALYRRLFSEVKPQKKLYRPLWELQKTVPLVVLFGRAVWFPAEFLLKYVPSISQAVNSCSPSVKDVMKYRQQWLNKQDASLIQQTQALYNQMCTWMVRIESELQLGEEPAPVDSEDQRKPNTGMSAVLNARAKLLLNGILLAGQIRNTVMSNIHCHLRLQKPFGTKNVRALALLSEMLQAIRLTYRRRLGMLAESMGHILGQTAFLLRRLLQPIRTRLQRHPKLDDSKQDVLAALSLAIQNLKQAPTRERLMVIQMGLSVAQLRQTVAKPQEYDEIKYQAWKLSLLTTWQHQIRSLCDCSFLYWVSNLVPAFMQDILNNPDQAPRLQYLFDALQDSVGYLECPALFGGIKSVAPALKSEDSATAAAAHWSPELFLRAYRKEVMNHFEESILNPIARAVETDLRLHIHSVVLQQQSLRSTAPSKDFSKFLNLRPLRIFDQSVDMRQSIQHYLDQTFYNLTTLAPHDWKVYAEMRNLALQKYGLEMVEVHLPGSAHYSESLDILEIMRNIHIFVSSYNYNMNTQVFVQRAYDQAHLSSINIHNIANSIRTHGIGIMNTTINFTYQFLVRKFKLFSEFLFDDHIKSRLIKEIRYYKAEKETLNNRYPFERAEAFAKSARKLGVTEDGRTFLDKFRQQITEIGNAMGYVRMVRSGGLHHVSNSIKYVPDLQNMYEVEESVSKSGLSPQTLESARQLDTVLDDLAQNFAEGSDYFKVLVDIFEPVFATESQAHLRNFFIIVPVLTLSFVDDMMVRKETLMKKGNSRGESSFTNDGFALGIAYILKLLGQDEAFNSLHWFDSVKEYVARQAQVIQQAKQVQSGKKGGKKGGKADGEAEQSQQHFQLTMKRIQNIHHEMELLFYSLSGARIFFQRAARDSDVSQLAAAGAASGSGGPVEQPAVVASSMPPPPPPPPPSGAGGAGLAPSSDGILPPPPLGMF